MRARFHFEVAPAFISETMIDPLSTFSYARSSSALLHCVAFIFSALLLNSTFPCASISAQQKNRNTSVATTSATYPTPALSRTTTRHEVRRFGYGSTLTLVGVPVGSVTIEAWTRSEIDITADIELRADTEEDLTLLATVNSFVIDEDVNHLRILTTGMHDKVFMRRAAKKFPKRLLGLPWKIDYRIRVPVATDLEINAGRGAFHLAGVEGTIRLNATESDASLLLTGGTVDATIGRGSANVRFATRSWRGRGVQVQLATGNIALELPAGWSGDIDADVLRLGQIENSFAALLPRERTLATARSLKARAGAGGSTHSFMVGDGSISIKQESASH